jgi:hypothetical protein
MWRVAAENKVYDYTDAANGAGPMWARGGTCLVQCGESLFCSGMETVPGVPPKSNTRWTLHQYAGGEWSRVNVDQVGYTREPSPLASMSDGTLWLSANPVIGTPTTGDMATLPQMLEFDARNPSADATIHMPVWSGNPQWFDHSYRSLAVDPAARELVMFNQFDMSATYWSLLDHNQQWSSHGILPFPGGCEPIHICYPTVAIQGRAVHLCGVSNIPEPNLAWRAYKKELTGLEWDYDLRRLFYTWTSDVAGHPFHEWVEIASREATAGLIVPCDMYLSSGGKVHLLWVEKAIDVRLREKFFPEAKQSYSLNYAIVRSGQVIHRQTIKQYEESDTACDIQFARFHAAPKGRLFVFSYSREWDNVNKKRIPIHQIVEIKADTTLGVPQTITLTSPLTDFYSANTRAGSPASNTLNLIGPTLAEPRTISHVSLELR